MTEFRARYLVVMLILGLVATGLASCVVELPATPVAVPSALPTVFPVGTPSTMAAWTVMLYLDADDAVLEQDIYYDLNEAELVGSTSRVHIVAQMDRYQGGFRGEPNWTTAKRFYVTKDANLERVGSREIADLGEVNMADGAVLADFVVWAMRQYPAEKYALILSDHGAGWPGGWSDASTNGVLPRGLPLGNSLGDILYTMELEEALQQALSVSGVDKLDVIGFDACLMGQLEVLYAAAPYAHYAVSSEEVEPSLGWAYRAFLQRLVTRPELSGAQLATAIVETYIDQDELIVDDQARIKFLQRAYNTNQRLTADQVAREINKSVTLSAVDLGELSGVVRALDSLLLELTMVQQKDVARARTYAQSFENVFAETSPKARPYIDLGHWALLLRDELRNNKVNSAVDGLVAAIDRAVIASRSGSQRMGATGVSIYFPNSTLFRNAASGQASYKLVAQSLADASLWDDYLVFHYTGQPMQTGGPTGPTPQPGGGGPGAEKVSIAPIVLSSSRTSVRSPVTLKTEIRGDRIGYLYFFVARIDERTGAMMIADMDYLEADAFKEIGGVTYPDWGDEAIVPITFTWTPTIFALSDGTRTEPALFAPDTYAATIEGLTYVSQGLYTIPGESRQVFARLYFDGNGILRRVLVFQGMTASGPMWELLWQPGDKFTIVQSWVKPLAGGDVGLELRTGSTLTLGEKNLEWVEVPAASGRYTLGMFVQDLDGNLYQEYAEVVVE